jgi:hypothetical protein
LVDDSEVSIGDSSIVCDAGDEMIDIGCSFIPADDRDDVNIASAVYCLEISFSVGSELETVIDLVARVPTSKVSVICCDTV